MILGLYLVEDKAILTSPATVRSSVYSPLEHTG